MAFKRLHPDALYPAKRVREDGEKKRADNARQSTEITSRMREHDPDGKKTAELLRKIREGKI